MKFGQEYLLNFLELLNNMKILFLPAYYYPEHVASSYLGDDLRYALCKNGFNVILYVPIPTRGITNDVRSKYRTKRFRKEFFFQGMLEVNRFPLMKEGKNPIARFFRYLLCIFKQFYLSLKVDRINCVYLTSTPPIQGVLGVMIKKIRKIPFVYNLQDIFPDSMVGTNLAKKGNLLWRIGRKLEDFIYRNADRIIVISDDFKKNIMAKGVLEEKIVVVYNWVDEKVVVPVAKDDNPLYDELGINREKFTVVYAGNFGHAQNIDVTIAAAERLKDIKEIQFLMFGTGGLVEDYKKITQEKGLTNVFFFPLQPVDKVSQVYSLGNLGIITCKKGLGKGAFPSKTWSIMSAGTPVLANYDEDTDLERLVKDNSLGVFSAADDSEQMAERIMDMYNNRDLCAEYGRNARQYILDNVSKEKSTQKYVDVIKEVVEENRKKKSKK